MPEAIRPVHPYAFVSSQRLPLPLRGINTVFYLSRPQWPRGLSGGSAGARLLELRVRIPSGGYECLSVVSVVCSTDRGPCDEPIPRPGVSYRVRMCH